MITLLKRFLLFVVLSLFIFTSVSGQKVFVSAYYNYSAIIDQTGSPRNEWTELIINNDNINLQNWTLRDNNSDQTNWQAPIKFNNPSFWNNMRAGTIIVIWHRPVDTALINHPTNYSKNDGHIELCANDPTYFSGGVFGVMPLWVGNSLNISLSGDIIELRDGANNHIHSLGHKDVPGSNFASLPLPKLNHSENLLGEKGSTVFICPGIDSTYYGWQAPQSGQVFTDTANNNLFKGIPESCNAGMNTNSNYWRNLRQPKWINPLLTATFISPATINLSWNTATDPYPTDGTQGYIILRNTVNSFSDPLDGHTYSAFDNIGTASVIGIISSSQTTTYTDSYTLSCGTNVYYRIYAFRYSTDEINGNDFNFARGRAYNETSYASATVTSPASPTPPTSASVNRDNFCEDDGGNIILSAVGGSGAYLEWFEGSCGGTLIGTANNLSIPSPTATTTYYVRWNSPGCPPSTCVQVTVTVSQAPTQSDAGPDQSKCGVLTTMLAGNNPLIGTGLWTKISGPGTVTFVNNALNTTSLTASMQGTYILRWTISNGGICAPSYDEVSVEFSNSVTVIAGSNSPVCSGEDILLTSSIAGATYLWTSSTGFSSNLQNPVISNSTSAYSGTYTVDVSNIPGGCLPSSDQITVTVINTPLTPPISSQNVTGNIQDVCIGYGLSYAIEPPTPGSTYSWNLSGGGFITYTGTSSLISINWGYIPGIYLLTVTETTADGCIGTPVSLNITVNTISTASVILSASNNPVCIGSPVTCTATSENEGNSPVYTWFRNEIQEAITNTPTYTYFLLVDADELYVQLSSSSPCALPNPAQSQPITMSVISSLIPTISISADNNPICSGSIVTFTSDTDGGGVNPVYEWHKNSLPVGTNSPSYTDIALLNNDTITCLLTSSESCASPATTTSNKEIMTVYPSVNPSIIITPDINPSCSGSPVTFTADVNYEGTMPFFQWVKNGVNVGTNSIIYTDNALADNDVVSCSLTSDALCASPVTVTSNQIIATVNPSPTVPGFSSLNPTVCGGNDGSISLTGLLPFTFYPLFYTYNGTPVNSSLSSDGSGVLVISGLYAGNFSSISVSLNGCSSAPFSVNLVDPGATAAPIMLSNSFALCSGEFAGLSASGCSGTITWSDGATGASHSVSPDVTTYYTATCTFNGCTSAPGEQVEVLVKPQPEISGYAVTPPSSFCNQDGIITLSGLIPNTAYTAYFSYDLIPGTHSGNTLANGDYQITGCHPTTYFNITIELDGCRSDSIDVVVEATNSPQPPQIMASEDTICAGQMVVLTAQGCNGIVTWSDGTLGQTLTTTLLSSSAFSATCNENSCESPAGNPLTIIVEPTEIASIEGNNNVCIEGMLLLNAIGNPVSYEWIMPDGTILFDQSLTKESISLADSGYYKLVSLDNQGCLDIDSIEITVNAPSEVSITSDNNFCAGIQQELNAGEGFSSYNWNDGSIGSSILAIDEGQYWVNVTDTNGCVVSDTIVLAICVHDIFIPNAFSPGGNGKNKVFRPVTGGMVLIDYSMIIYNRWGQKIFESNDYLNGWDGTLNGTAAPSGIYSYLIIYKTGDSQNQVNSEFQKVRGTVTLVK